MYLPRHLLQRALRLILVTAFAPLLISCASPGPPRPPSLHLPEVPADLTAQRVGTNVVLHWTTPSRTTDGSSIPEPLTAELCRDPNPASDAKQPSPCKVVLRLGVVPGPSTATDPLPIEFTSGPASLLAYRVRILNPDSRSAGLSHPAVIPTGAAPVPVADLHLSPTRNGVLLVWQPTPSPSIVEFERTLLSAPQKPQPPKSAQQKSPNPLAPVTEPTDIHLRTSENASASDPGGTLDRTAVRAQTYTYRAQRIRTVNLDGHAYELRSDPSSPVTIKLSDTFPPSVPTGLDAIPSGTGAIDLSWQPVTDPDLAGYHVYRRTPSGSFQRLTDKPVLGPAFSDTTVTPGTAYTYRVTAVDTTGNESTLSSETTETAQPPHTP